MGKFYNPEKAHEYYLAHRDKMREYAREHQKTHPRKKKQMSSHAYYMAHREEILAKRKKRYQERHGNGETQHRPYRRDDTQETICWDCAKAGGFCPWSEKDENGVCLFQPVEGWEAVPTAWDSLGNETVSDGSYLVTKCPMFEREDFGRYEQPTIRGVPIPCYLDIVETGERHTFATVKAAVDWFFKYENGKTKWFTVNQNLRLIKDTGCDWHGVTLWSIDGNGEETPEEE